MVATCWICGELADSSEHRIKKSDLIRLHGRGPYHGDSALAHCTAEGIASVRGPNSDRLKYKPSLCHHCNTTFTQPFDRAYETFIKWVAKNEETVFTQRFINFHDVYGPEFEVSQRNLFKYLTKSFGCRLVEAEVEVPTDMVALFKQDSFVTALRITFAVNEDILLLPFEDRSGFIGKGDLLKLVSKADPSVVTGFQWKEHVSWLTIFYWYNALPDGNLGSNWIANSQHIYLGSFSPLPQDMRTDVVNKAAFRQ